MELCPVPRPRRAHRGRRRSATTLGSVVLIAVVALVLVPLALGMDHTVVRDPAMGGALDAGSWQGSLLIDEGVPGEQVAVGDVVSFVPPQPWADAGPVTRRVVAVRAGNAVTRGDASARDDPWRLDLDRGGFSRTTLRVPLVGAVADGPRAWWVGGLGALLLGLSVLAARAPRKGFAAGRAEGRAAGRSPGRARSAS